MKKDTLMVVSGGMDSVTMLCEYAPRIAMAVTFDYGSNHNAREIECARFQCAKLDIPLMVIPLKFIGEHFASSLLSGPMPSPTAITMTKTCAAPSCPSATALCFPSQPALPRRTTWRT